MPRRTKEDALATRSGLLDAAELLFQAKGVSGTSLNDIAQAAGATRGAVYWHFTDKADLFNAMIERVSLPLEQALDQASSAQADPVEDMRRALVHALRQTSTDEQTRRVFEVATHKVEYVDELAAVRERHIKVRDECVARMAQGLRAGARRRKVSLAVPAQTAARGLHAMADGLIQNWLLQPGAFDLPATGAKVFDAYMAGLGLPRP